MERHLFTSESVTEGHPDKICDQISDAILDAYLKEDPYSRVACETCVSTDLVILLGEITSKASVNVQDVARSVIERIGYTAVSGFDPNTADFITALEKQSEDIALGVDNSLEHKQGDTSSFKLGAGDQGLMFGYAIEGNEAYMPQPIYLAHRLAKRLAYVRKKEILPYLRPDGKTQVTMEYDNNGAPVRVDTVVVSAQHAPEAASDRMLKDIITYVVDPVIPKKFLDENTKYFINPTGRFVSGGPKVDAGLTGRKIIVDTYGGSAHHGGGAFSGKDPSKVDRSAAYMARYVAKNIVAQGLAKECEIQVAYAIGVAEPVSIKLDTFGTGVYTDSVLVDHIRKKFDFRPGAIIERLDLRKPIYEQVAVYGHFGRADLNLPWERIDVDIT